jgi:hypothetical protein
MKYHIVTESGSEVTLDLPISPEATWLQFCSLPEVKILGPLLDITPDGMPDRWTEDEWMIMTIRNMGYKKSRKDNGQPLYEEIDEVDDDSGDLNP